MAGKQIGGRPHVVLSAAMSVDGYLDDAAPARLLLSNAADFDRVDELRAGCDAILVGAETIRRDDPGLRIRDAGRRAARRARGLPDHPLRVTLTRTGGLDPAARFFQPGDGPAPLVYAAAGATLTGTAGGATVTGGAGGATVTGTAGGATVTGAAAAATVTGVAEVIRVTALPELLADLGRRGVTRLLVEGGGRVHTQFLTEGLADELLLAVAPFFVGDPAAPRFAGPGVYPNGPGDRMTLAGVRSLGDMAVLHYLTNYRA
jgi:5-amino-6-(5-phosphoribosylamino)uracil reductase